MKCIKKQVLFILTFIAMLIISNKVYAADVTLSASNTNITTGTTVTITAGVQATETWKLNLTSTGGTLGGTTVTAEAAGIEVTQNAMSATFVATTPGTYTITLSGEVASSEDVDNGNKKDVSKSITITVSAPVTQPSPSTPTTAPTQTPAPTFSSVNETVYATTEVNVRSSYSTSSSSLGQLNKGDSITRIGVGSNGWSKVTYNGQTAYINSSYLTSTKPEATAEPSTEPSTTPIPAEQKSNDSALKTLSITGIQITPEFNSSVTSYTAIINEELTEIEVIAEPNSEKAIYEIVGNKDLQNGENIIVVTVTAEDGTVTNYEINLVQTKEQIDSNSFKIVGIMENNERVDIALGNPVILDEVVEYTVNLNEYVKSIEIQPLYSTDTNQYDGIGTFDLSVGENKFTVILNQTQGEGEEVKTIEYTITINNPEAVVLSTEDSNEINYKLILIIGIIVVCAILLIIFLIVYYKKQNEIEYANPDYSFLKNDKDIQNKEQEVVQGNMQNEAENNDFKNDTKKRKGGKHF